jgi:hypothetical protein
MKMEEIEMKLFRKIALFFAATVMVAFSAERMVLGEYFTNAN